MMKKNPAKTVVILALLLVLPAAAFAGSPVSRLKDTFTSYNAYEDALEAIVDQGAAAIPELMAIAGQDAPADPAAALAHHRARATAIQLLGDQNAVAALPLLTQILRTSTDVSAVNNAARAIARMGGASAYKILADTLALVNKSPDALFVERKKAVIVGLGLVGDKKAIPLLTAELNNAKNSLLVRIYAAGSLGLLGRQDGKALVTAALDSADPNVRLAAIRALGLIGSSTSTADLSSFTIPQEHRVIRQAAMLALSQIKAHGQPEASRAAFIKQEIMRNFGAADFVQWGTMSLKRMNTAEARQALKDMSGLTAPDYQHLRRAARLRMKVAR